MYTLVNLALHPQSYLFEIQKVAKNNYPHQEELAGFLDIPSQLDFRYNLVMKFLNEAGYPPQSLTA